MISKSFLKSSFVFTIGGALPVLASIILLPFYTNLLSDVLYTQILFYISVSLLFQILFSFATENYIGVKYTQLTGKPDEQKKFIGTISILLLIIGAGLLLLSAVFGDALFGLIYEEDIQMEFWPYGFYSILTGFFNSYFKASSICLIYMNKSRVFFITNLVNFLATIFISVGGLYLFPNTIVGPMYGRLFSGLIIFLMGHSIFAANGAIKLEKSFLRELAVFCTPYLFFVLSGWVLAHIDRYFLQSHIVKTELNAYDLMLKCFFGIEFLQNSLSAVIFPKIYEIWNKNKVNETTPESNRYFNVFTAINVIQLILFCIFIPIVYKLIIKNETFYQAEVYIGILSAGYALRGVLLFYLSTILFAKKNVVLLKIFGMSAVFQIFITWYAVNYFGLQGAIYGGLATKLLQVALCMLFTRGVFKYRFNYFKIIVIPLIFVTINIIQFIFFKEYLVSFYIAQFILFGVLLYLIFKNEIKKVLISFKLLPEA
jgi:O-antigen/teichoic acid export membrane protein